MTFAKMKRNTPHLVFPSMHITHSRGLSGALCAITNPEWKSNLSLEIDTVILSSLKVTYNMKLRYLGLHDVQQSHRLDYE